jgi:hypothetical protein
LETAGKSMEVVVDNGVIWIKGLRDVRVVRGRGHRQGTAPGVAPARTDYRTFSKRKIFGVRVLPLAVWEPVCAKCEENGKGAGVIEKILEVGGIGHCSTVSWAGSRARMNSYSWTKVGILDSYRPACELSWYG